MLYTIGRKVANRVTYAIAKDGAVTWTPDRAKATRFERAAALGLGQKLANRSRLQLSVADVKKKPARAKRRVTSRARGMSHKRKLKKNPDANPIRRALGAAVKLYKDFRGDEPTEVVEVRLPAKPRALLTVGECLGIMYRTRRDGKVEDYLHRFTKKARPTLAVSSDGLQLFLLGGAYSVTDRGIVDDA